MVRDNSQWPRKGGDTDGRSRDVCRILRDCAHRCSQVTRDYRARVLYSMFLVKWVPIFSKQTWILAKSSHFIESPFSLEHKIFRKKRSDRQFRRFCGEFCTLPVNHFHFAEFPFYREKIAADFVQKFPFYRIPILSRMYCSAAASIDGL